MPIPPTECPRCGSEQKFKTRHRPAYDSDDLIQIYIRCDMCRWEMSLGMTTEFIEAAKRKESKLRRKAQDERTRHGSISRSTMAAWTRAVDHLARLMRSLEEEVSKHGAAIDKRATNGRHRRS